MDANKQKALDLALGQIEKAFGKEAICKLGDSNIKKVEAIPTGALSLDLALGVGGLPRGRVIEIYGPEAGGKTTLSLHVAAQTQKMGGTVAFIDAEHALDPVYASALGVNVDELLVSQPDSGEQALEIAEKLVRSGAIDLIIIDSVAALVPKAEIEGEMGDAHVGLQARLMSQALRKLTSILSKTKTSIIFINQIRQKIGVMFGNPETTPGGLALKFYSSVRIDVRRIENIKKGDEIIGTRVRAKVTKNKVAPPYRQAEFMMILGQGISREACIIDKGVEAGYIEKSGSWFLYGDEKLGQGLDNARQYLVDNPDLANEIQDKLFVKYLGIHYDGKQLSEEEAAQKAQEAAKPAPAKKTAKK
ncbi:recombinase RecA [Candidatus Avelusimicrobium faecicola]|uniref:recombinase RecA n=1 Tax=Candidatus Avelusimicrobium faecicola TaxID=3416205 RepID=UPI0015A3BA0E|nr:recombinase RecA [Spirochaetota bacterium]MCI7535584.1 recombinase RecA [Spirochaetota bacterium]MDE3277000.1 recombinase RecA [Spirochaetota bacterium]MDY2939693.1 recombinase RecA [Elusimicrobiaceae bacterium]MDY6129227.1 recombinase RecA [Elusimicrobiaceae bacterium]